jgi:8-oxo-dGTP pyrophosphatase MutT (NUDIX family)
MLTFHAIGDWAPDRVRVTWAQSTRRIVAEVETLIEQEWKEAVAQPGVKLFDGPMCRMESWHANAELLQIVLSYTSYKPFLGTNIAHPEVADRFGREVMANPVGVSPALHTADNFLLMGRRNGSVVYYPNRTHPFAGALEPRDAGDLFAAVRRELFEELGLGDNDIAEVRCTGIAEDMALRQPELIFRVRSTLTRSRIESQVHTEEHGDSIAIPAQPDAVAQMLSDPALTPVATASLLLFGRVQFGLDWFDNARRQVTWITSPSLVN